MNKNHVALTVALSVLVVLSANGRKLLASEEVLITFPNSVSGMSRRGNCLVVVHYQTDERNRRIDLDWDSPEGESGGSGTEVTVANNGIPIVKDLNLSAGRYAFVATLRRSDGSTKVATQTVYVVNR